MKEQAWPVAGQAFYCSPSTPEKQAEPAKKAVSAAKSSQKPPEPAKKAVSGKIPALRSLPWLLEAREDFLLFKSTG
ncbi:hypothetical protein HQN90_23260 [Paenibacillus alba]|nr:hypothetical protein [Paenibacillus alba]